ncbi:angio-associated migratory cell protein [Phymastichus coffea]|uniref:angio-associated migratory cell protein n=1 Tax=Phymastichus coffea TaxID=108790 RepID=UPI00273B9093|nr:angio-associated migratory cell protein [Phymastichus coffea]
MVHHETPPASPYMEEVVEEIDDDAGVIGDVEIVEDYEVEEDGIEDGGEQMADEDGDIMEMMEREDAIVVFDKHTNSVFCGSLSKNGQYAVTGGQDDKAYVWSTSTGELILTAADDKESIIFADFSYDDQYLATGDMNGLIRVRKTLDWSIVWSDNSMGDATWMQWHPVAHVVIAGSESGELYMWKITDGECKVIQSFGQKPDVSCIMPDGRRIVVGYNDGVIRLIDLKSCSVISTITSNMGHTSAITSIDCHLDNNIILSAGVDGKTIVSSANTGKIISILQDLKGNSTNDEKDEEVSEASGNWIETIAFQKDVSQIAASGTISGDIFIWDIARKILRHKLNQGSGISKIVWKEKSTLFFTAGLDGILRCFDSRSGECLRTLLGHTDDILDLCISKDGKKALTVSEDKSARVFDIELP